MIFDDKFLQNMRQPMKKKYESRSCIENFDYTNIDHFYIKDHNYFNILQLESNFTFENTKKIEPTDSIKKCVQLKLLIAN